MEASKTLVLRETIEAVAYSRGLDDCDPWPAEDGDPRGHRLIAEYAVTTRADGKVEKRFLLDGLEYEGDTLIALSEALNRLITKADEESVTL